MLYPLSTWVQLRFSRCILSWASRTIRPPACLPLTTAVSMMPPLKDASVSLIKRWTGSFAGKAHPWSPPPHLSLLWPQWPGHDSFLFPPPPGLNLLTRQNSSMIGTVDFHRHLSSDRLRSTGEVTCKLSPMSRSPLELLLPPLSWGSLLVSVGTYSAASASLVHLHGLGVVQTSAQEYRELAA